MNVEFGGPGGGNDAHTTAPADMLGPPTVVSHVGGHQPYQTAPAASEQYYPSGGHAAPSGQTDPPPPTYEEQKHGAAAAANHAQLPAHASTHNQYHLPTVSAAPPSTDLQFSSEPPAAPYETPVNAVPSGQNHVPKEDVVHAEPPKEVPVNANRKPRAQLESSGNRTKIFNKVVDH